MSNPIPSSPRLSLQPLHPAHHLQGYHALFSDARVARWSNRPPTQTLSETKTLLTSRLPSAENPWMENYAIVVKPALGLGEGGEGVMVGSIGIPRLSRDGAAAEVGYGILAEFWGKGYAAEALGLFVGYYWGSWREFQKEVLVAETEPENRASERVLEKAGFQRGGLVHDAFEITNTVTGKKEMRDAVHWRFERPRKEVE